MRCHVKIHNYVLKLNPETNVAPGLEAYWWLAAQHVHGTQHDSALYLTRDQSKLPYLGHEAVNPHGE